MNRTLNRTLKKMTRKNDTAKNAWIALGGLLLLGIAVMAVREMPSLAREMKIMRM